MADATERHRLRTTFDEVPEIYERARAPYPPPLFDDLVALAGLRAGSRVLEIGCGTGRATLPLARLGLEIVCVELGERLAAFARAKLATFPNVTVVNARFEDWEPTLAEFDAVTAFTAFHWIDPETRYAKSARLLRDGGSLAVVETRHVLPDGADPFWVEVQEDYDAVVPSDENRPPPRPDEVPDLRDEIAETGLFGPVDVRTHLWTTRYTADEYIAVLETYSNHRALDEETRQRLHHRIRRRVERRPTRAVEQALLATLTVARSL